MEGFFLKLFDLKRIPAKFIFVVWASCCLILFVPEHFLSKLKLTEFLLEFGKYVGITFVITSGFLLVVLVTSVIDFFYEKKYREKLEQQIKKSLQELDYYEKSVIREFIIIGKHTLQLPFNDESVVSLTSKGILRQHSNSNIIRGFDMRLFYSISKIAEDNLTEEMLDIPKEQNNRDELEKWLLENRPSWNLDDDGY
jgi:hypothetical protein